ncbi:MAG: YdeI/OmpD-associated family protein [Opitutae bacterium]|nr:YdeI/OmpD-associated family protein [Opitutae bacterium]
MAQRDPRTDTYIAKSAPFAQPILQHLRKLVHQGNPAAEETVKWGMPFFTHRGKMFASLAAFKAHAAFGLHHQGLEKLLRREGAKVDDAMGLLGRITSLKDLPGDRTLLGYIRTAVKLHDSGLPARMKAKPKPALPVPADLAAALRENPKAAAVWADFSPGARRDYIEWVTEAKRPETRATRLATTLAWVAAGKKRHWKYENCGACHIRRPPADVN